MSKFVSLQTTLVERDYLVRALEDLDCQLLKTRKIQTLLQRTFDVDLAATTKFGTVGFVQRNGRFELAGDDMILAKSGDFLEKLTQRYAYHRVVDLAKKSGFHLVKEAVADNKIRLVLRKWQ